MKPQLACESFVECVPPDRTPSGGIGVTIPPCFSSPIFLGFALHRRSRRVLHLEPIRRAAGAIYRVLALRHDAFKSHAGVGEHGRAVAFHVLVEAQAKASFGQHTSKRGLAHFQRITPQVVAVQLDQVESVEEGVRLLMSIASPGRSRSWSNLHPSHIITREPGGVPSQGPPTETALRDRRSSGETDNRRPIQ